MSFSTPRRVSVLMCVLAFWTPGSAKEYDILIRGGQVIDGTGSAPQKLDVAIQGDRIVAVGDLQGDTARKVIDASKCVVTPGFIDVHSHAKAGLRTAELSAANSLLVNGVTTVIIGPDGNSSLDLQDEREDLEADGLGVNVAQMIGHGSIRAKFFGSQDRQPTERQLEEMKAYVRRAMENGAFGMSSGLFYANGHYAKTGEVVELSKVVGEYGGFYTSHIRDESNYTIGVLAAVEEVITIAREARIPGVVSHIKCLGPVVWDEAPKIVEAINKARADGVEVYADQYPWEASQTGFNAALWPRESLSGQALRDAIQKNLDRRGGPTMIGMNMYGGKRMSEVIGNKNPIDAVIEFKKKGVGSCVYYVMKPENKVLFMQQPWTMTCSDGGVKSLGRFSVSTHPRNFGSFARKIRKYVVEDKSITLPFAVRSVSGLAAEVCDIKDRGFIRAGAFADVLVFEPNEVKDRATYKKPRVRSTGMTFVIVNGKIAINKGQPNDAKAGIVLRHEYKIRGSRSFGEKTSKTSVAVGTPPIGGTLVIGGGGGIPDSVFEEFIKLAGSADSHIVVIPTASTRADSGDSSGTIETWKQRGAATVTVLHTRDRDVANKNEFIAPLKKATGVWFGGGSQSRITDAYLGTAVDRELRLLLKRGGVVGGSSAGAAIMTEVMIAGGNPKARTAKGFGFLPGAVVDQHFLRRNRVNRLIGVLQDHPGLVGFGIDEGTAIVVTGSHVRAVGRSYVTVLIAGSKQRPLYVEMLEDGEEVDLAELTADAARRIKPPAADETEGDVRNRPSAPKPSSTQRNPAPAPNP